VTKDPLPSAIDDTIALLADDPPATHELLRQVEVRLALAQAAAESEINQLAVEGLQQTLEDAQADADPAHRAYLLKELRIGAEAYALQLQFDALKGDLN
jgi:hypothetical protein